MSKVILFFVFFIPSLVLPTDYSWKKIDKNTWDICVSDNGTIYISSDHIYKSLDNGDTWEKIDPFFSELYMDIELSDDNYLICVSLDKLIYTSDGGTSWIDNSQFLHKHDIKKLKINKKNNYIYLTRQDTVFLSKDLGKTWSNISPDNFRIKVFAIHPVTNDIYAISTNSVFLKSTDNGETWQVIQQIIQDYWILSIDGNGKFYIVSGDGNADTYGLKESTDFTNWSDNIISGPFQDLSINNEFVFISEYYDGKYMISDDFGSTWYEIDNSKISDGGVYQTITVDDSGTLYIGSFEYLYIGTRDNVGVFDNCVSEFQLYPNPSNSDINISVVIEEASNYSIYIVDLLGNKRELFRSDIKLPGEYHHRFETDKNVTSGNYYLVLMVNGSVFGTRRITILK